MSAVYGHMSAGRGVSLYDGDLLLRFDVVLMREGRMKGQAFIGLPSETSAAKALRDTNGFVLQDKPLIVVSFTIRGVCRRTCVSVGVSACLCRSTSLYVFVFICSDRCSYIPINVEDCPQLLALMLRFAVFR